MDRIDAGKNMPDDLPGQQYDAAGRSRLEQLLNSHEENAEVELAPVQAPVAPPRPAGYRGAVDDPIHDPQPAVVNDVDRLQAAMLEKLNYEEDTEKFFMDDPDHPRRAPLSDEQRRQVFGRKETAMPLETLNGPPLVFGGMLLGISLTLLTLIWMGKLEVANTTSWYVFTGIGAAIGLMYAAQLRT